MFKDPLGAVIQRLRSWCEAKAKQIRNPELVVVLQQRHQPPEFQHRTVKSVQQQQWLPAADNGHRPAQVCIEAMQWQLQQADC